MNVMPLMYSKISPIKEQVNDLITPSNGVARALKKLHTSKGASLQMYSKISPIKEQVNDLITPSNGVARTLKKLRTSKGDNWIEQ